MEQKILGLHHITAIAGNAQRNYDFYTKVLGLRLVKKTVNFDDPGTYHFYFGDEWGSPGSILTFFPWEGIRTGLDGTGMATEIYFSVPANSFAFWTGRLQQYNVKHQPPFERFGETILPFEDNEGLRLNLVANTSDNRKPWATAEVKADVAIRGFQGVVLQVADSVGTAQVLTQIFGYRLQAQEANRQRFSTDAIGTANIVDVVTTPGGSRGINAAGTNHHVAFRVKDEATLMAFREKVMNAGLHITEKIDRNYFYSLYFREPGGVLFEIATDNPGFAVDEAVHELGTHLMLPPQYESSRNKIEAVLPALKL